MYNVAKPIPESRDTNCGLIITGSDLADVKCFFFFSHFRLFVTPWTVTCQAPLYMEFSRQDYWIGLPSPSLGGLLLTQIEHRSPALQTNALLLRHQGSLTSTCSP